MPDLAFDQYACFKPEHIYKLLEMSRNSKANTLVQAWCNHYHAPELEWAIREVFPCLVASDTFFNAGVMVFSKVPGSREVKLSPPLYNLFFDFEGKSWENDSLYKSTARASSGKYSLLMKPEQEFGPSVHLKASEMGLKKDATVMFSCKANVDTSVSELKLVVQVQRGNESILWRGFDIRSYQKKYGQWFSAYAGYKIQEHLLPDDDVSVYFYNPRKENVYLDDVHFSVY